MIRDDGFSVEETVHVHVNLCNLSLNRNGLEIRIKSYNKETTIEAQGYNTEYEEKWPRSASYSTRIFKG